MATKSRAGRLRGGTRPPLWVSDLEAVEYVPVRRPSQRVLNRLLADMQSHLDEMEKMRSALVDAYPLFLAGRGGCCCPGPPEPRPEKPDDDGGGAGGSEEDEEGAGYRFSLDVAGFAPEELSVQLQGRRLTVRAKQDRRSEAADGCVSHEYREVRKEVVLPNDADLGAVACALDGGRLCVRAPRLAPETAEPRDIPITVVGSTASGQSKEPPPTPPASPPKEEEEKKDEDAGRAAAADAP